MLICILLRFSLTIDGCESGVVEDGWLDTCLYLHLSPRADGIEE